MPPPVIGIEHCSPVPVWASPSTPELVCRAIAAAGGALVPVEEATAIVWSEGDADGLRDRLHAGIRWVQLPLAGIEEWLAAGVVDAERTWTCAKGSYSELVAEHALALLLAASTGTLWYARGQDVELERTPRRLRGSTVGIVGMGGIGRALTTLLAPFEARVMAITRNGHAAPGVAFAGCPDDLGRVLEASDYVVLAAPATSATRRIIAVPQLAAMRDHAWLVNVARGSLVDTDALVDALERGSIAGASLDVTEPEPLPADHPLRRLHNVLLTPHVGSTAALQAAPLAERVSENLRRFARGGGLVGEIRIDVGY